MASTKTLKNKQKSVRGAKKKVAVIVLTFFVIVCGIGAILFRYFEIDFGNYIKKKKLLLM